MRAEALLLGERISTQGLGPRLESQPLLIEVGRGRAAVFRYGAVVLFDLDDSAREWFLSQLKDRIAEPYPQPEREVLELEVADAEREGVRDGVLILHGLDNRRLQTVAEILGKSVVLAYFEARMADAFGTVEPLAEDLRHGARRAARSRELLDHIGNSLLIEHKMVGLAEVADKPEILWEQPELERLYVRLSDEFELPERTAALERKLVLIRTTVETVLELLQYNRTLRVEWYIVILIVVEILLTLYSMFVAPGGH